MLLRAGGIQNLVDPIDLESMAKSMQPHLTRGQVKYVDTRGVGATTTAMARDVPLFTQNNFFKKTRENHQP